MEKVKRKQIEFGGTEEQYIKGNGELGNFSERSDALVVTLKSQQSNIEDIVDEELSADVKLAKILDAMTNHRKIIWYFRIDGDLPFIYKLSESKLSQHTRDWHDYDGNTGTILNTLTEHYISQHLYLYDIHNNVYLDIILSITHYDGFSSNPRLQGLEDEMSIVGTYIKPLFRTLNHETVVPSSNGDANLNDGFYYPNAVQDYDGNWYGAVVIGDQVWLAENLHTRHYDDGIEIDVGNVNSDNTPYCYYPDGNEENVKQYGLLYNMAAVLKDEEQTNNNPSNVKGISPEGWHIPSFSEWQQLVYYLRNQNRYNVGVVGQTATVSKAIADTTGWNSNTIENTPGNEQEKNNSCGFSAKPAGMFYTRYDAIGNAFYMWTCTGTYDNCTFANVSVNDTSIVYVNSDTSSRTRRASAMSVRCISNLNPIQFRDWYIKRYGSLQHYLNEDEFAAVITYDGRFIDDVLNGNTSHYTFNFTPEELFNAYKSQKKVKYYLKSYPDTYDVANPIYSYKEFTVANDVSDGVNISDTALYLVLDLEIHDRQTTQNRAPKVCGIRLSVYYDLDENLNESDISNFNYIDQPNWDELDIYSRNYIRNKPTIDYYDVEFYSTTSGIGDVSSETLTCNRTADEIVAAVKAGKKLNYYVRFTENRNNYYLHLDEGNIGVSISNVNTDSESYYYGVNLYAIDWGNNLIYEVYLEAYSSQPNASSPSSLSVTATFNQTPSNSSQSDSYFVTITRTGDGTLNPYAFTCDKTAEDFTENVYTNGKHPIFILNIPSQHASFILNQANAEWVVSGGSTVSNYQNWLFYVFGSDRTDVLFELEHDSTDSTLDTITITSDTYPISTTSIDVSGKADKVSGATNGNFASLDSNGNLQDSGKKASDYYTKPEVDSIVSSVYKPKGSISSLSSLGTLDAAHEGFVYNMSAAFTTTSDFIEGAGSNYPIGTNIVIVNTGTTQLPVYKYDVLSGFVDLSNYAPLSSLPDVSTKYDTTDSAETSIDDADYFPFVDTSAFGRKKTLWSTIKDTLKSFFDSRYHAIINASNKLSADFIEDGSTNKVINVKPDWNAASGDPAEILNKPTINGQVSGINNGTQWTSFTIDGDTYDIPTPRQVGETFRTINGEEIFDRDWGDVNIHDGYYFPNVVQDYDGNWYGAVIIGNKVWLAENLRCTHYSDGTAITDASSVDPNDVTNPVPYYRDNINSSIPLEKRGLFYNWYAVMNGISASNSNPSGVKGIAPGTQANGDNIWHIPSKDEFEEFIEYIHEQSRYNYSGTGSSRSIASTEYWNYSIGKAHPGNNLRENNATNFCAIPVGNFVGDLNQGEGLRCSFWSTQEVNNDVGHYLDVEYNDAEIEVDCNMKYIARSVRCVCDLTPVQFRAWYVKQYGTMQHIVTNNNLEPQVFVCHYDNNSMDKTPAEIYAAHTAGKIVVCYDNTNKPFYLTTINYSNNVYNICFTSIETNAPIGTIINMRYILFYNNSTWIATGLGVTYVPAPSANDAGKILKVNAQGKYELVNA